MKIIISETQYNQLYDNLLNESLIKEKISGGGFSVYHRTNTNNPENFNKGYNINSGAMYGAGLYATYSLESQFTPYMERYGKTIIKFSISNNNRFIILDYLEANKIFGVNHTLIDQLKKVMGGFFIKFYNENKVALDNMNTQLSGNNVFTSHVAYPLSRLPNFIKYVDGLIFNDKDDGKVLVLYNINLSNPLQYTVDGTEWFNLKTKESHRIGREKRSDFNKNVNQALFTNGKFGSIDNLKDSDKLKYINFNIENGKTLTDTQLNLATPELIQKYIIKRIGDDYRLTSTELALSSDELKKQYIESRIDKDNQLTDQELDLATPNQKVKYIGYRTKRHYSSLTPKEKELASEFNL